METPATVEPHPPFSVPFTVTAQVALNDPSSLVTVIEAVPALTAVTTPLSLTFTIDSSEDVHLTPLFVAVSGERLAFSVSVPPTVQRQCDSLFKEIPVTGTTAL